MSVAQITLYVIVALLVTKAVLTIVLALYHLRVQRQRQAYSAAAPLPGVTVLIAAYNEEVGIADTLSSVLSQDVPQLQVIVVDDGSHDRTAEIARQFAHQDPRVLVLQQPNAGKAAALNHAIRYAQHPVSVSVDADSALAPGTLARLAAHFNDPRVGAVAGDVKVAGPATLLTQLQGIEYSVGQHLDKRAQDVLGAVSVVPGAAGAYRTELMQNLGGYSSDTLTEDMDLTFSIAAAGFQVRFEPDAISYTEPPTSVRNLWKQRMRWMYGTFQCMGKYRHAVLNPRAGRLGLLILPYTLVYGLTLGGAGPLFDLIALSVLLSHSVTDVLVPVLLNFATDFAAVALALGLGRRSWQGLAYTPTQRLLLRPFVFAVIAMTCVSLLRRRDVTWNKLPRVGLHLNPAAPDAPTVPAVITAAATAAPLPELAPAALAPTPEYAA